MGESAVFISYASQDAAVAQTLAHRLRDAGVDVWLDTQGLRGGDAWDRQIQGQIQQCALFVALISAHTETRSEGYFRREWRLAAERTRDMADDRPFLLPVAVEAVPERTARVPDAFRQVQWSRLGTPDALDALVARIGALLLGAASTPPLATLRPPVAPRIATAPATRRSLPPLAWTLSAVALVALVAALVIVRHRGAPARDQATSTVPSVAVLPFSDLSEKKDQEFLADGLTEDLIALLSKIPDLHVPARASSFFFKSKSLPPADMAAQLGVDNLLVGTVRRSAQRVRITAQLIQAANGRTLWSQTFDRGEEDVLQIQDGIAAAILQALRVAFRDPPSNGMAGSHFDAYKLLLEGRFLAQHGTAADSERALSAFRGAVALDPAYAPAWAALSRELTEQADNYGQDVASTYREARQAAQRAIDLQPRRIDGYIALADIYLQYDWDWQKATATADAARQLEPSSLAPSLELSYVEETLGQWEAARQRMQQAVARDPLNPSVHAGLGGNLYCAGRYEESVAELRKALDLAPDRGFTHSQLARSLMQQRHFDDAIEEAQREPNLEFRLWSLAMVYHAAGHQAEADATLARLEQQFPHGDESGIGWVHAARGEADPAFDWFERAYRVRDVGLVYLKCIPEAAPSVVQDPRFRVLLNKLNLPTD